MKFHNCEMEALTWFTNPPGGWANLADCGDFPCTGPKNTIFSFTNTEWTGNVPDGALADFRLIPDVPEYSKYIPTCVPKLDEMNGHLCTTEDLGILVWES